MGPPSRASSIASSSADTKPDAALLGAYMAFGRAAPKSIASVSTGSYAGNGAKTAASSVGGGGHSRSPSQSRSPHLSALSTRNGHGNVLNDGVNMDLTNLPQLAPPSQARTMHNRSPSQQAALMAASRAPPSAPPKVNVPVQRVQPPPQTDNRRPTAPKPRRSSDHAAKSDGSQEQRSTDTTSIAPTTSLVDLFEERSKTSLVQGKRPEPILIKPASDLAMKSPRPVRTGITSMLTLELEGNSSTKSAGVAFSPSKDASEGRGYSSDDSFTLAPGKTNTNDLERGNVQTSPLETPRQGVMTARPIQKQTLKMEKEPKGFPAPSLRQTVSKPIVIKPPQRPSTASNDSLSVSSSYSVRTIPAQFSQANPRRKTPLTTEDELANAMVASSLASSRAPSPMKEGPPMPTRKKKNHHHPLSFSRTPSPAKTGMLRTLRKHDDEESSSDVDDDGQHPYGHHKKKRLIRKHPNKHHEGDRKRWRDAVTERERRRYEGVWAANKGLHYSYTLAEQTFMWKAPNDPRTAEMKTVISEQVSNIVARDIWNRSRLPETVLETVWDLVDNDNVGRLQKEEFVVGMWLIDQRLKGRKLPVKVSESVWASVKGIHGIKVKVRK